MTLQLSGGPIEVATSHNWPDWDSFQVSCAKLELVAMTMDTGMNHGKWCVMSMHKDRGFQPLADFDARTGKFEFKIPSRLHSVVTLYYMTLCSKLMTEAYRGAR